MPKAKRIKIQELNSQNGESETVGLRARFKERRNLKNSLRGSDGEYIEKNTRRKLKNPNVTINNIVLQGEDGKLKRFKLNKNTKDYEKFMNNVIKQAGLQKVETNVENGEIPTVTVSTNTNTSENVVANTETANVVQHPNAVANANFVTMTEMLRTINMNQGTNVTENNVYNSSELSKVAVSMMKDQRPGVIKEAKERANAIARNRELKNIIRANTEANRRVNVGEKNKSDLDTMLKDTNGTAGARFQKYIDEQFGEELHMEPTKEEMAAIEAQARENVSKRQNMSEEEREKEYKKEKERLLGERENENRLFIEENVKEIILQDPKNAEIILGKENAEKLQGQMASNQNERDMAAIKELVKQELNEQKKYLRRHQEHAGRSYDDIYRLRRQEMMRNDLQTAVDQINTQGQNNVSDTNVITHPSTEIYMSNQAREAAKENEEVG